jgi:acid stress-induced BolA-like protein IbaG/YrbA|tara:strand:- start:2516 stop:2740 length:225 start_codon:yes stop_codon:yes gene_type:complete
MSPDEIKVLLEDGFEDCSIEVEGEDGHFKVTVIGTVFEGLSKVKRQQMVYSHLNERIKTGEIHAVMMTTLTPDE